MRTYAPLLGYVYVPCGVLALALGTNHQEAAAAVFVAAAFSLLWFLASHPRHVFSRDQIMSRVWGYDDGIDTGTVTVHVRRVREKIEDDPSEPRHLETIWGVGYRFTP